MKKRVVVLMIGLVASMLVACGAKSDDTEPVVENEIVEETVTETETNSDEADDSEAVVGMVNPWTTADKESVQQTLGFAPDAPADATEVAYSYMKEGQMAQVTYDYDYAHWTYRMQPTSELTDISGMNYVWDYQENGTVSGRDAIYYSYAEEAGGDGMLDDMKCVRVVNWYDKVTGITYSLSVTGPDLNGMDTQVYAENLFAPLQGESRGDNDEPDTAASLGMVGVFERDEDGSDLTITENPDGTLGVELSIVRLCLLENGIGTYGEYKIPVTFTDPSGNDIKCVIYRSNDDTISVEIVDSTWEYLPNGEVLEGFKKQ